MNNEGYGLQKLQDSLIEVEKGIRSLKDIANVLQFGFNAINDDNIRFSISTLTVFEELLWGLEKELCEGLKTLDTILKQEA